MAVPAETDWARRLHFLEPDGEGADLLLAGPPRLLRASLYVLAALLVSSLLWSWFSKVDIYITSRGAVRPAGDVAKVQAVAPGRITAVRVVEGQPVKAGDVLFVLDQRETETGIDQVTNELSGTGKRLDALRRNAASLFAQHRAQGESARIATESAAVGVARAREEERARSADVEKAGEVVAAARLDAERKERLFKESIVSESDLRAAQTQLKIAESSLRSAKADLEAAHQGVSAAQKNHQILVQQAEIATRERQQESENLAAQIVQLEQQEKSLDLEGVKMRAGLDHLEIRAPVAGTVTTVGARNVGEVAQVGAVMATIAPSNATWIVESWVPNVDAGPLREKIGTRVNLKFDAFPFRDYGALEGKLIEVAPDADFTNLGAAYRVKVALPTLEIHQGGRHGRVRLGMAVTAEIVKEEERVLMLLFRKVRDRVSYE